MKIKRLIKKLVNRLGLFTLSDMMYVIDNEEARMLCVVKKYLLDGKVDASGLYEALRRRNSGVIRSLVSRDTSRLKP